MKTQRRKHLDRCLSNASHLMTGNVIDIGGKKENKRGSFQPPLSQVKSWKYVNIDQSTSPDYCCSADNIPVADESIDAALLCEVLEHLENPEKVIYEAARILRKGGVLILSAPFMFPLHADPHDYQRWTDSKIKMELQAAGLEDINVAPMGGLGAVIHDLLLISFLRKERSSIRRFGKLALNITRPVFALLDSVFPYMLVGATTGFFVTAQKKVK